MRDIRVCLDLNVWVRQFLNVAAGKTGTVPQAICDIVASGRWHAGGVQLVVSHSMLDRLARALVRLGAAPIDAEGFVAGIETIALVGPYREAASIVLGGGFQPTRDAVQMPYDAHDRRLAPPRIDAEDGRVLDAALAGAADLLVTNNMKDFAVHSDAVLKNRVRVKTTPDRRLAILGPADALAYLRTGAVPELGDVLPHAGA